MLYITKYYRFSIGIIVGIVLVLSGAGCVNNETDQQNTGVVPEDNNSQGNDISSVDFPDEPKSEYFSFQDWPPRVEVSPTNYVCEEQEFSQTSRKYVTEKTINGDAYCVHAQTEGAAGSVLTEVTYLTEHNNGVLSVEFAIRTPRCENYEEAKQEACVQEQSDLDLDALVADIVERAT